MSYDSPNATVRREQSFTTAAGNGAVGARMLNYQKLKLVAAHWEVVTAGTSDSPGHALTIKNGTTSIGLAAIGTATAGATGSVDLGDSEVASLDGVTCTNGTDATGVAVVNYEYEVVHDTTQSS